MSATKKIWSKSKRKAVYLSGGACHIWGLHKHPDAGIPLNKMTFAFASIDVF